MVQTLHIWKEFICWRHSVTLPTPIFNGPYETTELEEPIRQYIRETALYEKVLEAMRDSSF